MNLSIWNPFREMERYLDRWSGQRRSDDRELTVADWLPAVDIHETNEAYELAVELPGVEKEDVGVTIDQGTLTIRGERKNLKQAEENGKIHRIECHYGTFSRSFTLPEEVDDTKVSATYQNGMLHLSVPKSEKAKPRSIEVKIR
jgi:HSP20 family protein